MSKIFEIGGGAVLDLVYPVGSIYLSVNSTSPATLFGGTWEQIKDKFLLACGSTYSNGQTGGEATHKLTVDEIPAHNHSEIRMQASYGSGGDRIAIGTQYSGYTFNKSVNTGGGQAHNNMPPYYAVYMWKRTA